MKNLKIILALFILLFSWNNSVSQEIKRIEPPFWWTNMNNKELQLMVYGKNINQLTPEIDYPGIIIESTIHVKNDNYLFINLKINKKAKPGEFNLKFNNNTKTLLTHSYSLKKRGQNSANREGFNNSDVIYLITPDRFANGNPENDHIQGLEEKRNRNKPGGRHGGDLQGIINHLDYLQKMGITAIWTNPLLENNMPRYSYHGYSTTDYYKIDPRFGSNELYKELSKEAKEKGIKLLMDMIPNHCGSEHWWIKDPPTKDWFHYPDKKTKTTHQRTTLWDPYASQIDEEHFKNGWFVKTMPDLNQDNELLSTYLIQNAIWWIEYANLAGIRVDTYPYSGKNFMAEWTCRIRKEYPNLNVVGEEWTTNPAIVASWQKGSDINPEYQSCLPSLMDFPTQDALVRALNEEEGWGSGMIRIYRSLANDFLYQNPYNLVVFPDNHDMSRFYTLVNEDFQLFKLGIVFIATTRGIPQILYGTEILKNNPGTNDHGVIRSDFPGGWKGDDKNAFTGKNLAPKEMEAQRFFRKLLNWRKNEKVIHTGKLKHYLPEEGLYTYFRYNEEKTIMVILNKNAKKTQKINTERYKECLKGKTKGVNILSGEKIGNLDQLEIKPKEALIIELKR